MIYWLLQTILISILVIVSAHKFFDFIKNSLTPHRQVDVYNVSSQKYKDIHECIRDESCNKKKDNLSLSTKDGVNAVQKDGELKLDMRDELRSFIKEALYKNKI